MIRPGIAIGRVRRAGVVDLYRGLVDSPVVAVLSHTGSVQSTCGLKTASAVRELQPERGSKGVMAESEDGFGTVRLDQHGGATYISK